MSITDNTIVAFIQNKKELEFYGAFEDMASAEKELTLTEETKDVRIIACTVKQILNGILWVK